MGNILRLNKDWPTWVPNSDDESYHTRSRRQRANNRPTEDAHAEENPLDGYLGFFEGCLRGRIFFTTSNGFVGFGMPGVVVAIR